jgi:hypothetical protein
MCSPKVTLVKQSPFVFLGFRHGKRKRAFRAALFCESLRQRQRLVAAIVETAKAGAELLELHRLGAGRQCCDEFERRTNYHEQYGTVTGSTAWILFLCLVLYFPWYILNCCEPKFLSRHITTHLYAHLWYFFTCGRVCESSIHIRTILILDWRTSLFKFLPWKISQQNICSSVKVL